MGVLKDFQCECGISERYTDSDAQSILCENCGKYAKRVFIKSAAVTKCDSYNGHFDIQMGQYFGSKEEKDSWLKKAGREQVSGSSSPRRSSKDRIICSKEQSKTIWGKTPELWTHRN